MCEKTPGEVDQHSLFIHCTNKNCVLYDVDVEKGLWGGSLVEVKSNASISLETENKFMNPDEAIR